MNAELVSDNDNMPSLQEEEFEESSAEEDAKRISNNRVSIKKVLDIDENGELESSGLNEDTVEEGSIALHDSVRSHDSRLPLKKVRLDLKDTKKPNSTV